jgi:hypothetical protein
MNKQRLAILITSAFGLLGCFLPWYPWYAISGESTIGLNYSDGQFTAIFYLIPLIFSIAGNRSTSLQFPSLLIVVIPTGLAVLVGLVHIEDIRAAVGLYLIVFCGVLSIIASFVLKERATFENRSRVIRLDPRITRLHCTTCGHEQPAEAIICEKCGCNLLEGKDFCYRCGSKTNPNAIICVSCGVSFVNSSAKRDHLRPFMPTQNLLTIIKKPVFYYLIVLFIAFYLDWFALDSQKFTGMEIVGFRAFVQSFDQDLLTRSYLSLIDIVPLLCLILLMGLFYETPKRRKRMAFLEIVVAMCPWVFLTLVLVSNSNFRNWLQYGLYITLAASTLLFFDGVIALAKKKSDFTLSEKKLQASIEVTAPLASNVDIS